MRIFFTFRQTVFCMRAYQHMYPTALERLDAKEAGRASQAWQQLHAASRTWPKTLRSRVIDTWSTSNMLSYATILEGPC
jgi:hypothetical protein